MAYRYIKFYLSDNDPRDQDLHAVLAAMPKAYRSQRIKDMLHHALRSPKFNTRPEIPALKIQPLNHPTIPARKPTLSKPSKENIDPYCALNHGMLNRTMRRNLK